MSLTLSELFEASHGLPVDWFGQQVHMMHEFTVSGSGMALSAEFRTVSAQRPQGVRIKVRGGTVQFEDRALADVVLWSDTSPERVVAPIRASRADQPVLIRAWNAWRDQNGTMQAWIGNAGLLIHEERDGATVLSGSDGFGDPTFDDLVVALRLLPVP